MFLQILYFWTLAIALLLFKTLRIGDWILSPSPETGTIFTSWAQLSRFYLKTETESRLRNVVF
jgi:hypothetical protein